MESYSQFTNQYIVEVASQLNAMSERAANLTGFKEASRNVSISSHAWSTVIPKCRKVLYDVFKQDDIGVCEE